MPCIATLNELVLSYPKESREKIRKKWKLIIDSVFKANNFSSGKGTNDIDKDIMICANMYAEPAFRYEEGEEFWKNEE